MKRRAGPPSRRCGAIWTDDLAISRRLGGHLGGFQALHLRVAQPGQVSHVVVAAAQTTRDMQSPKPRESLTLLQVTINKVADGWQVSDIGPKTGSRPAEPDPLTPPVPGAPSSAPEPAPAPGH
ncbi:hypothetical protein ACOJVU_18190 [Mycobacterium sp. THU-M104]|uniref:hypothetical protein n=1 Tax=Mycobacterium sp. THU-M104 TaxID=3410515 RepID=UPI003B9BEF6D